MDVVTAVPGWEDAAGGWTAAELPPGVLDAAAGLAGRLAEHGLGLACALAARSVASGRGLAVTVPLPARALEDVALADRFAAIAAEHGAEPRALVCNVGDGRARPRHARARRAHAAADQGLRRRPGAFGSGAARRSSSRALPLTGVKVDARS